MLKFKNVNIVFGVLLLTLIATGLVGKFNFWLIGCLVLLYSVIVFYGVYFIQSNFFIPVYCSANTTSKEIALTFDDGPSEEHTRQIAEFLQQNNIQATFFCIGRRINENEELLKELHKKGHLIGNHSYSHHFWFDLFSTDKMLDDLNKTDEQVKRIIGLQPKLFRPPYGVINPNLTKAIKKGNYDTVGWNVRSYDTVITDKNKLLAKLTTALKPGAVFLLHDTCKITLEVLPEFVKTAKKQGYKFVRVDKLFKIKGYA
ncbi:polysaccharide deacetylase family protein [Solitalea longa]|uniref:Polysaccharide deacetylase family protein n=1 Tax=Solitalea longa TaxID=2079460 RepID=A0A2S5A2L4_9SPHI|nr:polysaccharide deacetylase family protein [Solitalea longa]POY36549.1 polysaccharide deacetylase family protein [Solitalea longa]